METEASLKFSALGTEWHILTPYALKETHKKQLLALVYDFQSKYSRFNPDSLLSKLNMNKKLHHPPIEMLAMFRFALDMYDCSDGLFNISVGAKLEQAGYGKISDLSARVSSDLRNDIILSPERIEIAPHVRLDFGGFGKGWLVDQLHDFLMQQGYPDHVVNGGGDIRVGRRSEIIYVENPLSAGESIGSVQLQNEGFAASSAFKRQWRTKTGEVKQHIMNPLGALERDSMPLQMCTRATNCAAADVAATVLLLLGEHQRHKYAECMQVRFMELLPGSIILHADTFKLEAVH